MSDLKRLGDDEEKKVKYEKYKFKKKKNEE